MDTTNVLAKVEHRFSDRDQFSVRYSRYNVTADELARRRRPERADRIIESRQHSTRRWPSATL